LDRSLRWAVLLASGFYVLLFLYIAVHRMVYPYQLEIIEEGMMTSVWRLRHGFALYGPPSLEWAPYLYGPLFFYLAAAFSKVMGIGFAPLRAVSILSTLGSLSIIFAIVWKETRRFPAAFAAMGLFASLYSLVYGLFDVGRVDSLAVFLFLLAIFATRWMHPVLAALLWLLAFEAKQTYLPLGLAVFLVEWARPKRMVAGMAAFAALAWASIAWTNRITGHWFQFYAFGTTGQLGWLAPRLAFLSLPMDLAMFLQIALGVILVAALLKPMQWREREGSFYAIVTVLLVGAVWFVRAHRGANINADFPLLAWLCILTGIGLHRLLGLCESHEGFAAASRWRISGAGLIWLVVALQLAAHVYHPSGELGAAKRGDVRQQFIDELRRTPGDVWMVDESYTALQAGKPLHADMFSLDAVLGRPYAPAVAEFQQAMQSHRFSAVVFDQYPTNYAPKGVFTEPPFSTAYPLMVIYHNEAKARSGDEPLYVLLPCSALTGPQVGLLDTRHGFIDRSGCP
jgi:hypothetical protein